MEEKRIVLVYPRGSMYQRGEDRCQQNIDDASAEPIRACTDLGYAAAILLQKGYDVKLRDYMTERASLNDLHIEMAEYKPDLIMMSITNTTIYGDLDVSSIKTKPVGRKDVITKVVLESEIVKALEMMNDQLKLGHQVYVIAPLIMGHHLIKKSKIIWIVKLFFVSLHP